MKDLVRVIRERLDFSQEQLAASLGVSSVTISRWENGKAAPSVLAQRQLYEICKSNGLDLIDYIVDRERDGSSGLVLYHASKKGILSPIAPVSRDKCDFGKGFYMGTDPLQPLTLVCSEESPKFYSLNLDLTNLKVLDVGFGMDWAMLIAFYRGYMSNYSASPLYDRYAYFADGYDVICGYIADDRMYQVLTDFFELRITDTALLGSLSALKLGKQYVAKTQKGCDAITIHSVRELSKLELMVLKEKSIVRRKEGLAATDRIVKDHRRDGRYFDEILQGGLV